MVSLIYRRDFTAGEAFFLFGADGVALLIDAVAGVGDLRAVLFPVELDSRVAFEELTAMARLGAVGTGSVTGGATIERLGSGSRIIGAPGVSNAPPKAVMERVLIEAHPVSTSVTATIAARRLVSWNMKNTPERDDRERASNTHVWDVDAGNEKSTAKYPDGLQTAYGRNSVHAHIKYRGHLARLRTSG